MDPNTALERIRAEFNQDEWTSETIEHVREHFEALDEWITNGGFLPDAWDPFKRAFAKSQAGGQQ